MMLHTKSYHLALAAFSVLHSVSAQNIPTTIVFCKGRADNGTCVGMSIYAYQAGKCLPLGEGYGDKRSVFQVSGLPCDLLTRSHPQNNVENVRCHMYVDAECNGKADGQCRKI